MQSVFTNSTYSNSQTLFVNPRYVHRVPDIQHAIHNLLGASGCRHWIRYLFVLDLPACHPIGLGSYTPRYFISGK
jgi:hypothetical protein